MSFPVSSDSESKVFQIKGSPEFANRTSLIFKGLNDLEEKHDKWKAETSVVLDVQKPDPPSAAEIIDCKNVIFKRPRLPLCLKRKRHEDVVPDYIMNPHKWKKYSLADTPNVTEESNTAAALQFLQDQRKNREAHIVSEHMEVIEYRKLGATQDEVTDVDSVQEESEELSPHSFTCSTVHRMPELVVGGKRRKPAKSLKVNTDVRASVKLDHLKEHFDDD